MSARASDIINLNVGGTLISTKRSTLIQAEGSFLASCVNGDWEHGTEGERQAAIFLDLDPYCFQHILFYLRQRLIDTEPVPYTVVDPPKQREFDSLVQHLMLDEYMQRPLPYSGLFFIKAHPEIQLRTNGSRAVSTGQNANYKSAVIGEDISPDAVFTLECIVEPNQDTAVDSWVFLGIGCSNMQAEGCNGDTANAPQNHPSAYGWSSPVETYVGGNNRPINDYFPNRYWRS